MLINSNNKSLAADVQGLAASTENTVMGTMSNVQVFNITK
jgi:hypothetical protein